MERLIMPIDEIHAHFQIVEFRIEGLADRGQFGAFARVHHQLRRIVGACRWLLLSELRRLVGRGRLLVRIVILLSSLERFLLR